MSKIIAEEIWSNFKSQRDAGEISHLVSHAVLYTLFNAADISQETDRDISQAMQYLKKDGRVMYRNSYRSWQFLYEPTVRQKDTFADDQKTLRGLEKIRKQSQ